MKTFLIVVGIVMLLVIVTIVGSVVSVGSWFAGRSVEVAQQQFDPQELLRKYEWFKDSRSQLDKKKADISIYQQRIASIDKKYEGRELPRVRAEQYMIWEQELSGIKASYNSLAADYNSQMAKFNWRFCNAGQLPQGATEVLPREYATYEER